jgi:hypothetical protein
MFNYDWLLFCSKFFCFSRYGTDAAAVADAALATAGNSYLTFYNTAALGPKGIAKRVAKVRILLFLLWSGSGHNCLF